MSVKFNVFLDNLLEKAEVVCVPDAEQFADSCWYALPVSSKHHRAISDKINGDFGDGLLLDGVTYGLGKGKIISLNPLDVCGFSGCYDGFAANLKREFVVDVRRACEMISLMREYGEVRKCAGFHSPALKSAHIIDVEGLFKDIALSYAGKLIEVAKPYFAYSLVSEALFHFPKEKLVGRLFQGELSYFDSLEMADEFIAEFDPKAGIEYMDQIFDVGALNARVNKYNANKLSDTFMGFAESGDCGEYLVECETKSSDRKSGVGRQDFKEWFEGLRCACFDQGCLDWWADFQYDMLVDFNAEHKPAMPGDTVVCHDASIRVNKHDILVSLPSNISKAVFAYTIKHAPDSLTKKQAS